MPRVRRCPVSLLGLTVSLAFLVPFAHAQESVKALQSEAQPSDGARVIQFANDRLTVQVHEVPLQELLQEIARQSGLTLVLAGPMDERMTIQFEQLPFDKGLQRILRGQTFGLQYAAPNPGAGSTTQDAVGLPKGSGDVGRLGRHPAV